MKMIKKLMNMAVVVAGLMPIWGACAAENNELRAAAGQDCKEAGAVLDSAVLDTEKAILEFWMAAIKQKDLIRVRELIDQGADINRADKEGWTPLVLGIADNDRDMVKILLDNGADTNKAGIHGFTPLSMAIAQKNSVIAKMLIDAGGNPNAINEEGESLLREAVLYQDNGMIKTLILGGAKYDLSPDSVLNDQNLLILTMLDVRDSLGAQDWDKPELSAEIESCVPVLVSDLCPVIAEYADYYYDHVFSECLNGKADLHADDRSNSKDDLLDIVKEYVGGLYPDKAFSQELTHYRRVLEEIPLTIRERQARREGAAAVAVVPAEESPVEIDSQLEK